MKITKAEFTRRRKKLMSMMDKNSIAIIPGAREVTRSRDTEYPFRQNSDLFYLTGFEEPDAVLVLLPGRRQGQVILFCRERDPDMELWNGYRLGPEGAIAYLGLDDAFPIDDLDEILPGLIEGTNRIYYSMGHDDHFDQRVMGWVNQIRRLARSGAAPPADFTDLAFLLHEQRLIKSAAELRVMRKAGEISAEAHIRAMRECRAGRYEYHLEASIQHTFAEHGARFPAYNSIVGSGVNACVLHYTENNARMRGGDLVLIDAGCEYEGYAADITRTFPVSGQFSPEQRALYDLVLAAQKAAIEVLMEEPEHHARLWENTNYFRKELQSMGFDTGDSITPIIPVMCGESSTAKAMTHALGEEGVMAGAIVFPMVARDKARIRTQMSAGLSRQDLDDVLACFERVGPRLGLI